MKKFKYLILLFLLAACTKVPPPKKGSTIVINKIKLSGGDIADIYVYYEEIPSGKESYFRTDGI